MGLEAATHISQLVTSNPTGGDAEQQGDDHLRLIKTVLQNDFPNINRAQYFPRMITKAANFSVLNTQQEMTFLVDTSAGVVTATLPTLAAGDDGWQCYFVKTNTGTNPLFIAPPAGTIQSGEVVGLIKTRRCIPGRRTKVFWTGSSFIAERVENDPISTIKAVHLSAVPVGYEPANGTSLSSAANYPDYNTAVGSLVVPDATGRVIAGKEAVATRLTTAVSGIDGATLGAVGGSQSIVLSQANLPAANLSGAGLTVGTSINNGTQVTRSLANGDFSNFGAGPGGHNVFDGVSNPAATLSLASGAVSGTVPLGGSATPVNDTQPTIVELYIVVVE